jgi:hypothetical protein
MNFSKMAPAMLLKLSLLHHHGEVFHNPTSKHGPLRHFLEKGMWEEPYLGSMFAEEGLLWKRVCTGLQVDIFVTPAVYT